MEKKRFDYNKYMEELQKKLGSDRAFK